MLLNHTTIFVIRQEDKRTPDTATHSTNLIFSLSPLTISPFFARNSAISHLQLTYRPANHSLFSCVKNTIVSAASSGVSLSPTHHPNHPISLHHNNIRDGPKSQEQNKKESYRYAFASAYSAPAASSRPPDAQHNTAPLDPRTPP